MNQRPDGRTPRSMMGSRHTLNLASGVFYFAARAVCAVIQLRVVTQYIGAEYGGLNAVLNQVIYYVMLAEMGLSTAAISLLYAPVERGDLPETAGLLSALRGDIRRLMWVAAPLSLPLIYVYSRSVHSEIPWAIAFTCMVLVAASTLTTLVTVHCQAYLNASGQIYRTNVILGGGALLKTVVGLSAAVYLHSYLAVPAAVALLTMGEVFLLRRTFRAAFPTFAGFHLAEHTLKLRGQAKYVLFHKVGGLIYYQSDFIILSLAASLVAVKTYAQYQYLAAGMIGLFNAAFASLTASIAARLIAASPDERRRQYGTVCLAAYFAAFCLAGAFRYSVGSFVEALFHEDRGLGSGVVTLFAVLLFLNLSKTVDDVFITARGAFRPGFYLPLMEAAGYIAQGAVLVRWMGSEGILWAGIATNLIFAVVAKSIVVARAVAETPAPMFLLRKAMSLAAAAVLAVPVYLVFSRIDALALNATWKFVLINVVAVSYVLPVSLAIVQRGFAVAPETVPVVEPEEVVS
ncbi:lipopolysaccharide biosynthesis protein [Paludibaculum fermentans]|uniref:lipopolysaccharide biosynthesis protein n=1 Tax=Paludibaculum fermentans TaxID=1473598 RepID=UPI003EBB8628